MSNVTPIGPRAVRPSAADSAGNAPMDVINDVACLVSQARAVVDAITDVDAAGIEFNANHAYAVLTLLDLAYKRICEVRPEPAA